MKVWENPVWRETGGGWGNSGEEEEGKENQNKEEERTRAEGWDPQKIQLPYLQQGGATLRGAAEGVHQQTQEPD